MFNCLYLLCSTDDVMSLSIVRNGENSMDVCELYPSVSVLFSDIVDFSDICTELKAAVQVQLLDSRTMFNQVEVKSPFLYRLQFLSTTSTQSWTTSWSSTMSTRYLPYIFYTYKAGHVGPRNFFGLGLGSDPSQSVRTRTRTRTHFGLKANWKFSGELAKMGHKMYMWIVRVNHWFFRA